MSESICTSCTSLRRINTQLVSFPNGCENFFRLKQGVLTGKSTSHARSAQAACTAAPKQTPLTQLLSRRERKASGQLCRVHSTLGASPSAADSSHSTHWVRPSADGPPLLLGVSQNPPLTLCPWAPGQCHTPLPRTGQRPRVGGHTCVLLLRPFPRVKLLHPGALCAQPSKYPQVSKWLSQWTLPAAAGVPATSLLPVRFHPPFQKAPDSYRPQSICHFILVSPLSCSVLCEVIKTVTCRQGIMTQGQNSEALTVLR